MQLLPAGTGQSTDGTRIVYYLNYLWNPVNGPSQKDFNDTYDALINYTTTGPITDWKKVILKAEQHTTGFVINYVKFSDATSLEIASSTLKGIVVETGRLGDSIVETVKNLTSGVGSFWDDLKNLIKEFGTYLLIFAVLIVVLWIWGKTR